MLKVTDTNTPIYGQSHAEYTTTY